MGLYKSVPKLGVPSGIHRQGELASFSMRSSLVPRLSLPKRKREPGNIVGLKLRTSSALNVVTPIRLQNGIT